MQQPLLVGISVRLKTHSMPQHSYECLAAADYRFAMAKLKVTLLHVFRALSMRLAPFRPVIITPGFLCLGQLTGLLLPQGTALRWLS